MIYIVYITTNLINDKVYIGIHEQEEPFEFDGYLGSGKLINRAVNKYGRENFKRETLFYYWTRDEARAKEREIVTEDFVKHDWNYNRNPGGGGSGSGALNPAYGKTPYNKGKPGPVQTPEQIEAQRQRAIERNWGARLKPQYGNKYRVGSGPNKTSFKPGVYSGLKAGDPRLCRGERNAMANPEHRAKVAKAKTGLKRQYQPDGSFKMIRPTG